jgi:hypothetical protein
MVAASDSNSLDLQEEPKLAANDDNAPTEAIELRVNEIGQLFHSLDPFPFRERDLDQEAEEYIVSWARELPHDQPVKIIIHLPEREAQTKAASELGEAFARYFSYRASIVQHELNELFRIGRRSLVIGMTTLVVCLVLAHLASRYLAEGPFRSLVEQSLPILGWVANWRPLEIFLYDWWPLARRRDLYRRLSAATLETKAYSEK